VRILDFGRYALNSCAAAALLAGCGGSQPPIGAPEFFSAAHEARVLNPLRMQFLEEAPAGRQYKVTFADVCG
jgi:hypothetical protein